MQNRPCLKSNQCRHIFSNMFHCHFVPIKPKWQTIAAFNGQAVDLCVPYKRFSNKEIYFTACAGTNYNKFQ